MSFILENPIILLILIGFISSLLKKVKNNNPEDGKQRRRQIPTTRPSSVPIEQKARKNRPGYQQSRNETTRQQKVQPKPIYNDVSNQSELVPQRNTRSKKISDEQAKTIQSNRSISDRFSEKEASAVSRPLQIDQERLIDGLIWSEVLGPPRAKKPHRTIK